MEIIRLHNHNHTRLTRLHGIWNTSKPNTIIIMLYPEKELFRDDSALLSKIRHILERNGYGAFTMVFQYPIIIKPEDEFIPRKVSKEALLKNLVEYEHTLKKFLETKNTHDIICAWGSIDNDSCMWLPFLYLADKYDFDTKCFGTTIDYAPKRPHYLPLTTQILPYEAIR